MSMYLFFVSLRTAAVDAPTTDQSIVRQKERSVFGIEAHALLDSVHQNVFDIFPFRY